MDIDELVTHNLAFYKTIEPKNTRDNYTVIATINDYDTKQLIALATGTQANLKNDADDIEDCHAESLVKRAYKRYIIDAVDRVVSISESRDDICSKIRESIPSKLILFISQFPCGVLKRYQGDETCDDGTIMRRKPGRGTPIDGKIVYVGKNDCATKLQKWIATGFQGKLLRSTFNVESKIKQILIGNCETDDDFDYEEQMNQFKQLIGSDDYSIDVDLLNQVRCDQLVYNPSKQAFPEAIVWWASAVDRRDVKKSIASPGPNIEYIVNGRRRGVTKRQLARARASKQDLSISTRRLRQDVALISHRLNQLRAPS